MKLISVCVLAGILFASAQANQPRLDFSEANSGCFVHTMRHPAMEVLEGRRLSILTLELCYNICRQFHFQLFGLHNGENCYCSSAILTKDRVADPLRDCRVKCVGSVGTCGGTDAIDAYSIARVQVNGVLPPRRPTNVAALGCYKYSRRFPLLQVINYMPETLSFDNCYKDCANLGFKYFGLFNGDTCYCGTEIRRYQPELRCDVPCPVKRSETCGGRNGIEAYEIINKMYI